MIEFEQGGKRYVALFYNGVEFAYYFDKSEYHRIKQLNGNRVSKLILEKPENIVHEFSTFTIASGTVTAYAELFSTNDRYCGEKYTWTANITVSPDRLRGSGVTESIVPSEPDSQFIGYRECETRDRVVEGAGLYLFDALIANATTEEEIDALVDYCNQISALGKQSTSPGPDVSTISLQDYLEDNSVTSIDELQEVFYVGPSREGVIFSEYNLWQDLNQEKYNTASTDYVRGGHYAYSYRDLKARYFLFNEADFEGFESAIRQAESNGKAVPISQQDGVDQYVAKYNTYSAIFLAMEHYFIELPMIEMATGMSKLANKVFSNTDNFASSSRELKKVLGEIEQFNKLNGLVDNLSSNSKTFLNNTLKPSVTDRSVKLMLGTQDEIWMVASRGTDEKLIATMTKSSGQDVLRITDDGWIDDVVTSGDGFVNLGDDVKVLAANGDDLSGKVKVGQKNGRYYFVESALEIPEVLATKLGGQASELTNWLSKNGDASGLLNTLDEAIGNKTILRVKEDDAGRFLVQTEGANRNNVHAIVRRQDGTYVNHDFISYKPSANPDIDVPLSDNLLAPDYSGTRYMYDIAGTDNKNIVRIKMTGKRGTNSGDFYAANTEAGFVDEFGSKAPTKMIEGERVQFTWHHLDDMVDENGDIWCTMQLVEADAHTTVKGFGHSGSVAQYQVYTGNIYD